MQISNISSGCFPLLLPYTSLWPLLFSFCDANVLVSYGAAVTFPKDPIIQMSCSYSLYFQSILLSSESPISIQASHPPIHTRRSVYKCALHSPTRNESKNNLLRTHLPLRIPPISHLPSQTKFESADHRAASNLSYSLLRPC